MPHANFRIVNDSKPENMMSQLIEHSKPDLFGLLARESTLAERVTDQLKGIIVSGDLQAGDRMPPERELARQFGVSRTVVREAVRSLMAQGLLEVYAGSGTIVRNPSVGAVAESMALILQVGREGFDYRKIQEVRRLLEVEIAGLAAERRTQDDLDALRTTLGETAQFAEDCDGWLKNDMAFHAQLAKSTKNELFSLLLDSIADIMVSVRRLGFNVPNATLRTLKYHGAILERVREGDREGARSAMSDHLDEAETTMRTALAMRSQQNG